MSFIDDLLKDAQQAGRSISQNGAQLLHTAQQQTSSFFQLNNGKITGPLAAKFGSDPFVFFNAALKDNLNFWVRVSNSVASRAHRESYGVINPKTGKNVDVPAVTSLKQPFNVIAMTVCLAALNHPDVFIDAAGREASGVKGGSGVDDCYYWPGTMAVAGGAGRESGNGIAFVDDLLLALPTIAAIATALAAIAGFVLPLLVSAVSFVIKAVAPKPDPAATPPAGGDTVAGIPIVAILVVVAVLVGVVFLWKPKAKAG